MLVSSVSQSCLIPCDPWTEAFQVSLSITNCQSLLKLMLIMQTAKTYQSKTQKKETYKNLINDQVTNYRN